MININSINSTLSAMIGWRCHPPRYSVKLKSFGAAAAAEGRFKKIAAVGSITAMTACAAKTWS